MKVADSKPNFVPLNITIESEAELVNLYHKLNMGPSDTYERIHPVVNQLLRANSQMWNVINSACEARGINVESLRG